jgi:16S rRNA (guanine(966)-N(2))-methyltransferase RsmD
MRIISGTAKGRRLKEPRGDEIRPTSGMVKESIFNIIQFDIEGRNVLDLFAGTGQLGIEALSRGAGRVVFVDSSPGAIKLIKENIAICGFAGAASVYARDALDYLRGDEKYDIIFLDPPYGSALFDRALEKIIEFDKINTNGIIIGETKANNAAASIPEPFFTQKEYKYGSVKITRLDKIMQI